MATVGGVDVDRRAGLQVVDAIEKSGAPVGLVCSIGVRLLSLAERDVHPAGGGFRARVRRYRDLDDWCGRLSEADPAGERSSQRGDDGQGRGREQSIDVHETVS